jgi:hypothetical protein
MAYIAFFWVLNTKSAMILFQVIDYVLTNKATKPAAFDSICRYGDKFFLAIASMIQMMCIRGVGRPGGVTYEDVFPSEGEFWRAKAAPLRVLWELLTNEAGLNVNAVRNL